MIKHADYVFANEDEADLFATEHNLAKSRLEVAKFIAKREKLNTNRKRVVIITQQADPVIVAQWDPKTSEFELREWVVPVVPKEKIVDTNGAGDAFVGGFLSAIGLEKSIDEALKAGNFTAAQVIQQLGCTFPRECEFNLF